jgi:opacity protein-like surface antigen
MKIRFVAALLLFGMFNINAEEANKRHSISFGFSSYDEDRTDDLFEFDFVEDKLTAQLSYQYSFNEYLSLRAQRLETTSSEFSSVADSRDLGFDFQSNGILADVKWPLIKRLYVNAFAGVALTKTKYDGFRVVEGDILISDKKTDSTSSPTFGFGLKYQLGRFNVGIEKQWLEIEHLDLELTTFIVGYRF